MNLKWGSADYRMLGVRKRILMSVLAGGMLVALTGPLAGSASADPDGRTDSEENTQMVTVNGCDAVDVTLVRADYEIFLLHNERRDELGMKEFCLDVNLTEAAQGHADDMIARGYYGHYSPEGEGPSDRIARTDFCWEGGAENAGPTLGGVAPRSIFDRWMGSPEHRSNIEGDRTRIGIGSAAAPGESETSYGRNYKNVVNFGDECRTPDPGDGGSDDGGPKAENAKPVVGKLAVSKFRTKLSRPILKTTVRDSDSSIVRSDIKVRLNGRSVSFVYNAKTDTLKAQPTNKVKAGRSVYTVIVNDGEGGKATKTKRFVAGRG